MTETPGMRRAAKPCADCNTPILPPATRCPIHQAQHNAAHNAARTHYHTPTWEAQRKRIISRDHDQCVLCGITRGLHVHHIDHDAYRPYVPDRRLVTLCSTHHMKIEREHQTGQHGPIHRMLDAHLRDSPMH